LAAADTAVGKNKKARSNAGFFFCSIADCSLQPVPLETVDVALPCQAFSLACWTPRDRFCALEDDPEKWLPGFRKDHAQTKRWSAMTIRRKVIPL
jgi:hypothetical protein